MLPLSEQRSIGFPALISLSLSIHHHPVSVLYAHCLLWLVSTLALTLTIKQRLGRPWLALVMLCYLGFIHKNFAFELFLMSEHLASCLCCGYLAILLWDFWHPSLKRMVLLSIISFVAIATKTTMLILLPTTSIYLVLLVRLCPQQRWRDSAGRVLPRSAAPGSDRARSDPSTGPGGIGSRVTAWWKIPSVERGSLTEA